MKKKFELTPEQLAEVQRLFDESGSLAEDLEKYPTPEEETK